MDTVKIDARDVNFWYGDFHALKGISMQIEEKSVVAFIGPSGCGKSTFLRLFNRMNDLIPATRLEGEIRIDGQNIYAKGVEVDELRKNVGMVFQRPNPFPKSIFENVAYGLRVNGVKDNAFIRQRVEETLKGAALWDEVKDKLKESAYALSGGQQQRLCIARAMAVSPSVLLMTVAPIRPSLRLNEVVVTGTGTEHYLKDAPVQTEVITGKAIDSYQGRSMQDILEGLNASITFNPSDMGSGIQMNGIRQRLHLDPYQWQTDQRRYRRTKRLEYYQPRQYRTYRDRKRCRLFPVWLGRYRRCYQYYHEKEPG